MSSTQSKSSKRVVSARALLATETIPMLRARATRLNVTLPQRATKEDLVDAIVRKVAAERRVKSRQTTAATPQLVPKRGRTSVPSTQTKPKLKPKVKTKTPVVKKPATGTDLDTREKAEAFLATLENGKRARAYGTTLGPHQLEFARGMVLSASRQHGYTPPPLPKAVTKTVAAPNGGMSRFLKAVASDESELDEANHWDSENEGNHWGDDDDEDA